MNIYENAIHWLSANERSVYMAVNTGFTTTLTGARYRGCPSDVSLSSIFICHGAFHVFFFSHKSQRGSILAIRADHLPRTGPQLRRPT